MQDMDSITGTDQQFVMLRNAMREKIFERIGRKQSSAEWRKRLPELAKRLEEVLYRKFPNKNDYYNMMKGPVEPQLQFAIKTLSAQNQQNQQNPQMSRQMASSSGYGMMIPTPGSMSNGYQHLNNTITQNSTPNSIQSAMGSVGVQRQLPHMIPTPGFSNQQNVPVNPESSNVPQLLFAIKTYKDRKQQNQQDPQMARETASSSGTITQDENHHAGLCEQFATPPADMQNENADELVRTESTAL